MHVCPHCQELLAVLPDSTIVACSCAGAVQERLVERERSRSWSIDRDRALAEERQKRRRRAS